MMHLQVDAMIEARTQFTFTIPNVITAFYSYQLHLTMTIESDITSTFTSFIQHRYMFEVIVLFKSSADTHTKYLTAVDNYNLINNLSVCFVFLVV